MADQLPLDAVTVMFARDLLASAQAPVGLHAGIPWLAGTVAGLAKVGPLQRLAGALVTDQPCGHTVTVVLAGLLLAGAQAPIALLTGVSWLARTVA